MKKLRILPYKMGSQSARYLTRVLGGLRIRPNSPTYRPRTNHLIVNWGSTTRPPWWRTGLNPPEVVVLSTNKRLALRTLRDAGVPVPVFVNTREEAIAWARADKPPVIVARTILNSHSGRGCVVWEPGQAIENIPNCQLYTKHLRHKREFRIHVFEGRVIDQVEKLKRRGFEDRNSWIRNHANGYVFCRQGIRVPDIVRQVAIQACQALRLDFGAVDVAYREKDNQAFVFEVNTAPGIEGQTIQSYAQAIKEKLQIR